jgi:hypothetical protein
MKEVIVIGWDTTKRMDFFINKKERILENQSSGQMSVNMSPIKRRSGYRIS